MSTVLDTNVTADVAADQSPGRTPARNTTSPRCRFLHLINGEHYAGSRACAGLARARLARFRHRTGIRLPQTGPIRRNTPVASDSAVSTADAVAMGLPAGLALGAAARHERFDILHTHTPRKALIGRMAATFAGVPMVHHVHGQTATEVRGGWWTRWMARIESTCLSQAAATVAVSPTAAEYMVRQGLARSRLHVIPNGVPARATLPLRPVPETEWTLGMVGLLRPRKGLETVLDALALLRQQSFSVRLRVIGSFETPGYQREVEQHVACLGIGSAVDWAGFCSDIDTQLARLDLWHSPACSPRGCRWLCLKQWRRACRWWPAVSPA